MSVILGLNFHHADSAACLLVDGRLVGAVAEERLGDRLKHSPAFPENARGRALVKRQFAWRAIAKDMRASYESIVEQSRVMGRV